MQGAHLAQVSPARRVVMKLGAEHRARDATIIEGERRVRVAQSPRSNARRHRASSHTRMHIDEERLCRAKASPGEVAFLHRPVAHRSRENLHPLIASSSRPESSPTQRASWALNTLTGSRITAWPSLRTVTSSPSKRNAFGRRTAWLPPCRNNLASTDGALRTRRRSLRHRDHNATSHSSLRGRRYVPRRCDRSRGPWSDFQEQAPSDPRCDPSPSPRKVTAPLTGHHAVIVGQCQVHHRPDDDLAVDHDRSILDLVHAEDAGLRRVEDRRRHQ